MTLKWRMLNGVSQAVALITTPGVALAECQHPSATGSGLCNCWSLTLVTLKALLRGRPALTACGGVSLGTSASASSAGGVWWSRPTTACCFLATVWLGPHACTCPPASVLTVAFAQWQHPSQSGEVLLLTHPFPPCIQQGQLPGRVGGPPNEIQHGPDSGP